MQKSVIRLIILGLALATFSALSICLFASEASDCIKNPDGTYSCTQNQDEDQDHKTNLKVTGDNAIHLGSNCTKNSDGTYSCTQNQIKNNIDDGISEDNNENDDTTASIPNAPNPTPIPYPNTNNN